MQDCKLVARLEDKPGELSKILDIVARNKGNLFSIAHLREKSKDNKVPVVVKFQGTEQTFKDITADMKKAEVEITEKSFGSLEESNLLRDFILIGHVIDTDLRDTIYSLCGQGAMIKALDFSIQGLKHPSSVFVEVVANNSSSMEKTMAEMKKITKKKELLMIEQLE